MTQHLLKHQEAYDRLDLDLETDDVASYPADFDLSRSSAHQQHPGRSRPMTVVLQSPLGPRRYADYPARASKSLGEFQIAMGVVAAILNGIGLFLQLNRIYMNVAFFVVCGIWGVLFFSLSGSFAIMAGKRKTTCPIVTHMVLAIFGSATAFVLIGQGAGGIAFEVINTRDTDHLDKFDTSKEHHMVMASLVISVGLLICGLIEFVICIWSCTLCCKIMCCEPAPGSTRNGPDQPMIVVSGRGQAILNANSYLTDSLDMNSVLPPPYSNS